MRNRKYHLENREFDGKMIHIFSFVLKCGATLCELSSHHVAVDVTDLNESMRLNDSVVHTLMFDAMANNMSQIQSRSMLQ